MMFNGVVILLSVVFSLLLTYVVRIWSINRAIIDIPNERSSHTNPTPRGGGIAIAITWFIVITVMRFFNKLDCSLYFALLLGLPISIIGLVDDIVTVSARSRLIIQILSAVGAVLLLGGIKDIDGWSLSVYQTIILSAIAIVGIVWFTNLFNFLDGIDGYISTEIIFIGIASFLLFGATLPLMLAAVTAGFLVWNWQPAKIFMGDVGSTLLGFTIGVFAIYYQSKGDSSIVVWLMLTSLFWFDATFTLYRRWRNRETLSKAHKKHAYQRIVQSGFSHQKTVFYSILINLFILILVWLAIQYSAFSLLFFAVNIIFLYYIMKLVDKRFSFPK
ncbi:MAG: glycosyltransferase family 4 protein [Bacteroidia bacterium]|nr:glycosyltransferase family 4 protein [Bacteroidia bacterium]